MPVMISRSGRWPWRTTRCRPVSVLRSACFAKNSATSASMAWVSSARAPLRRISVRQSVKAPGWANSMTLLSDTAYHSFVGEVGASNTTTIRRLIPSPRHQLLAIAHPAVENQATDRAFRIGQKKNVLVHKFVCRGTVEEKIDTLIDSKQGLSDELLTGADEINLTEMTNDDIMRMVSLDLNAAMKE